METHKHDLSHLLRQLGLFAESTAMDAFIANHHLPSGVALEQAAFWSPMQAMFLREAIAEDSEWAEAVDELAARLG